jgi:hypothetical protein
LTAYSMSLPWGMTVKDVPVAAPTLWATVGMSTA